MDEFLKYLVKKSDLEKNEYFNYRQPKEKIPKKSFSIDYINEPISKDYVVFDIETTGMSCEKNKIIEIGAIKAIDNKIIGTFNVLINPKCYISPFISNLTHITNDMVKDKPDISVVLPRFIDFIGDLPLIAHNARFDVSFIQHNAKMINKDLVNPVIDTLKLSRKFNKECAKHNLGYLSNFFNIKLDNAHRAYFDALATFEIYKIIQQKFLNI